MARRSLIAVLIFLCACQSDYQFHTVAVYETPRGQYSIRIESRGVVRGGHDISEQAAGTLTVSPSGVPGASSPAPLTIAIGLRESVVRFGGEWPAVGAGADRNELVVSRLLSDAGYSVYQDEIEELVSATEGVLLGPKGTPMSGQTKLLRVVSTDFDR